MAWVLDHIPDLAGQVALVTGANSGIGWALPPMHGPFTRLGTQPSLRAATDSSAHNGSYWGPSGCMQLRGSPSELRIPARALNATTARECLSCQPGLQEMRPMHEASEAAWPPRQAAILAATGNLSDYKRRMALAIRIIVMGANEVET